MKPLNIPLNNTTALQSALYPITSRIVLKARLLREKLKKGSEDASMVTRARTTSQLKFVELTLNVNPSGLNDLPVVEQQLAAIATVIMSHWEPSEHWSNTSFIISQNSISLGTSASVVLLATAAFYIAEIKKRKRANIRVISKLNTTDAIIFRTLLQMEKPASLGTLAGKL